MEIMIIAELGTILFNLVITVYDSVAYNIAVTITLPTKHAVLLLNTTVNENKNAIKRYYF